MRPEELTDCIVYQVGALKGFLDREGMELFHVKPHGSLYGMAAKSAEVAKAVADAAKVFNVPVLGMAGTMHERVYTAEGLQFISEYYADLDYADDGSLIITREHQAVDPKRAAERALRAVREGVTELGQWRRRAHSRRLHLRPFRYAQCGCRRAGRQDGGGGLSRLADALRGGARMAQHQVLVRCPEFSTGGRRRESRLTRRTAIGLRKATSA